MKAYIQLIDVPSQNNRACKALVVSEQDYYERGPNAHSHKTRIYPAAALAKAAAKEWAEENGYDIYSVDEIAG